MALTGWDATKKLTVTIDQTLIDGTLTDFPVLLNLGSSVGKTSFDASAVFTELGASSKKIAVEVGDTGVECFVEIERWDSGAGEAQLWVLVPEVSASAATVLHLYYDSAHADNDAVALDSSTALLIESDTSDGSTTITDSSASAHTVTPTGNVHHEVDQARFGATSLYFDGAGDYLTIPASADWDWSSDGIVTIDFWVYKTVAGTQQTLINSWTTIGTYDWYCCFTTGNKLALYPQGYPGVGLLTGTTSVSTGVWHHVALVSDGSQTKLYLDGVLDGSIAYPILGNSARAIHLGVNGNTLSGHYLTGYLDEIRISKGVVRWAGNFTPPEVPYTAGYVGDQGSAIAAAVWDDDFSSVYHLNNATTVVDSKGRADLTCTGAALVAGNVGKALEFDGSTSYLSGAGSGPGWSGDFVGSIEALIYSHDTATLKSVSAAGTASALQVFGLALGSSAANKLSAQFNGHEFEETTASLSQNTWLNVAATKAAGAINTTTILYTGGAAAVSGSGSSSTPNFVANVHYVGQDESGGSKFDGVIRELRYSTVVRSAAWIKASHYSNMDLLITYALGGPVVGFLTQPYGAGEVRNNLVQSCGLVLGSSLEQPYGAGDVQGSLVQIWGMKLLGQLKQPYGNAYMVNGWLKQYYGDTILVQNKLVQKYGDALAVQNSLEQPYMLPVPLQSVLAQHYGITGTEVQGFISQVYDLYENDLVRSTLVQPWSVALAEAEVQTVDLEVTVGGTVVLPIHIDYEGTLSMYCLSAEIHLADQAEYLACHVDDELVITVEGESFYFFVEDRYRQVKHGSVTYIVAGLSHTARMDAPYALPLTEEFGPGLASSIAAGVAASFGITVDWQLVDDYYPTGKLYANGETPLAFLRRWAEQLGGILQTTPAGALEVKYDYEVSPPPTYNGRENWDTVAPAAYLSDLDNFFTIAENPDSRDGFNRYSVSDQLTSANTVRLESETISATVKKIKGFVTPWDDAREFVLTTSGGDWVQIEPLGVGTEELTEVVEFVQGAGSTAKPIYAMNNDKTAWQQADLGGVIFGEDGTLQADVGGESLLSITYTTKFYLWRCTDPRIEDVQFVLLEDIGVAAEALYPGPDTYPGNNIYPGEQA